MMVAFYGGFDLLSKAARHVVLANTRTDHFIFYFMILITVICIKPANKCVDWCRSLVQTHNYGSPCSIVVTNKTSGLFP